jgi:hypothetical protein
MLVVVPITAVMLQDKYLRFHLQMELHLSHLVLLDRPHYLMEHPLELVWDVEKQATKENKL